MESLPPTPVTFRPRRIRWVAWAGALVVLAVSAGLGAALSGPVVGGRGEITLADQVALVGLGAIGAAALLLLVRPRVVADADKVEVRNLLGPVTVPWQVVRAVRFDPGASWATLELADDDQIGVLAVQAVDKEYAVTAVRTLRALHHAHSRTP